MHVYVYVYIYICTRYKGYELLIAPFKLPMATSGIVWSGCVGKGGIITHTRGGLDMLMIMKPRVWFLYVFFRNLALWVGSGCLAWGGRLGKWLACGKPLKGGSGGGGL